MAKLVFETHHSLVDTEILKQYNIVMQDEIKRVKDANSIGYSDERASVTLPFDKKNVEEVKKAVKAVGKADVIVVVGIGGSNLGTMAIAEAIFGKNINEIHKPKIYFSDTTDEYALTDLCGLLEKDLKKKRKVVINIVSKSGSTTETIANFEVLLALVSKYDKQYQKHIVVTTDHGSKLYELAHASGFHTLHIPKRVGGRYSVFSSVGLFPLAMLGIDITKLLKGAQNAFSYCTNNVLTENPAAHRAAVIREQFGKGIVSANMFLFSAQLESLGKWYRQLMGESLGKEYNRSNSKKLNAGIIPTISIGSTDLHSMAQLYLGGPRNTIHTFVIPEFPSKLKVPNYKEYEELVGSIQKKGIAVLMEAIVTGVQTAFEKDKRPIMTIRLSKLDEEAIGELMQTFMIEMMYLGYLMDVNPFDQPNVESYKKVTRGILEGM